MPTLVVAAAAAAVAAGAERRSVVAWLYAVRVRRMATLEVEVEAVAVAVAVGRGRRRCSKVRRGRRRRGVVAEESTEVVAEALAGEGTAGHTGLVGVAAAVLAWPAHPPLRPAEHNTAAIACAIEPAVRRG